MPNWCEGYLKVRGTFDNLKNFIKNALEPVDFLGEPTEALNCQDDDNSFYMDCNNAIFYINNTHRHFCEPDYIEFYSDEYKSDDGKITIVLPMKAAWSINTEELQSICQEFCVDMKVQGFECGMEFSQIIEIVNGEIIQDIKIKYGDWVWDCPCPTMGG